MIDPYYFFMAEAEGFLNTRESQIQRVIREIKNYPAETMPQSAFEEACKHQGLNPASLSSLEVNRIKEAINTFS